MSMKKITHSRFTFISTDIPHRRFCKEIIPRKRTTPATRLSMEVNREDEKKIIKIETMNLIPLGPTLSFPHVTMNLYVELIFSLDR